MKALGDASTDTGSSSAPMSSSLAQAAADTDAEPGTDEIAAESGGTNEIGSNRGADCWELERIDFLALPFLNLGAGADAGAAAEEAQTLSTATESCKTLGDSSKKLAARSTMSGELASGGKESGMASNTRAAFGAFFLLLFCAASKSKSFMARSSDNGSRKLSRMPHSSMTAAKSRLIL